jgi:hypothetical protein
VKLFDFKGGERDRSFPTLAWNSVDSLCDRQPFSLTKTIFSIGEEDYSVLND